MKLARPLLITVGVLFILGALATGIALLPSVQRRAVLYAAAKQPGLQLKLDSVSAGFSSITVRGMQLEHRGVKVTLAQLRAEYSLWALLSGRRLQLGRLTAQGVLVDASQLSPERTQAGMAAAPTAAPGALAQVKLPWELTLGAIALEGRVLLPGAPGQPALQGEFKLTGGQIGPGREGDLQLKARVSDPAPGAKVRTLDALATMQIRESPEGTFDHIILTSLLDASGPGLPGPNQLKLVAELNRGTTGENYRLKIDTLRAGQSENLLALNAVLSPGDQSCAGDWTLSVRSAQLESFLLGRALPKFVANGAGHFSYAPAPARATVQGGVQIEASGFDQYRPELHALGPVRVKGDFDVTVGPEVIRFNKLEIGLAGEQPVIELHTTGAPAFNFVRHRLEPASQASGEIIRLKLSGLPLAWVAPFCPVADISGGLITGEIAVVQAGGNQLNLQTSIPLQVDGVAVAHAGRKLLDKAELKIDAEAEISSTRAHAKIRNFTVKTAAGDTVRAALVLNAPFGFRPPVAVDVDFSADLPTLLLPLLPAGPLKARGFLGINWQGERMEILRLAAESTDAKGRLLGSVTVTRAFTFDLVRGRVETGAPNEVQLASIKFGQLPLVTVPRVLADYDVSGRLGPADGIVSAVGGKLALHATSPVPVLDFSVAQKKKVLLDRLKLRIQPVVEFNDGAMTRIQSGEVVLLNGADVPLAGLNAEITAGDSGLRAKSTFNFDLPAWASQPALVGRDALSSGQASGEVRAAFSGGAAQIEARATINGLVARESGQALPIANLSLRADVDAAGHVSLDAPVLLDHAGQRSDLHFSAEGAIAPRGLSFEAKLTSGHIELRDMLLMLAVAGSPLGEEGAESVSAQSRALSPPAADQAAFWSGTTGHIALDCQSIASGQDWAMSGLTGRLVVDGDRLQLEKLEATFDEQSRFSAKGLLSYATGLNPYQLRGEVTLTEFDSGKFFKALDPEQAPPVEGLFTIKGQVEGQGLNFDDTIDRTRGTFDLTSRKGVFRGLKRASDKLSMASKAVGLVSSLLGDKSAEKLAGTAFNVEQLAQELGELNFDQFTVRLVRDPALNLRLENITLVAQQIHFLGSGQVTYAAGKPLFEQSLEATLSFRARGKIEDILGKLKALDGTRDELGYAKTKEALTLGGTLAKPNATEFFLRLAAGKPNDSSAPEN